MFPTRLISVALLLTLPAAVRAESLEEAWGMALAVSQRLRAQAELTGSADETLAAAKAARCPNLTNNAGYYGLTTQPSYKIGFLGATFPLPISQSAYFTSLSLINQPLYTSGRIKYTIAAAAAEVRAAQSEEASTVLDLKMEVAEAYIRVLYARRLVTVAESNVTALEAHVKEINNLIQQKQRVRSDLLAAQVQLADARQASLQARNNLDLANASYSRYLGRPLTDPVQVDELQQLPMPADVDALTGQALAIRPELATLLFQQEGLCRQADAVRAETKPSVVAQGGFFYFQNRFLVQDYWGIAGIAVKWDLDCQTKHRANALSRRACAAAARRAEVESQIALQVRQTFLEVQTADERVEATKAAVAQSEDNLKEALNRFRNNLATNTEVLDAVTLRLRASANYYNALYNTVLAVLRLRRAVGDL